MPVSFSSAFKTGLAVTILTLATPSVQAAMPNTTTLQSQLQNEWNRFSQMLGPHVSGNNAVTLVKDGLNYKATFPATNVTLEDGTRLKINEVTLNATPDASGVVNMTMVLPSSIPQYGSKAKIGTLDIGSQDIKATLKPVNDGLEVQSFDGTLGNVSWTSENVKNLAIGNIIVNGKATQTQISLKDVAVTNENKTRRTIDNVTVTQDAPSQYAMHLSDVLGLLITANPKNDNSQNLFKSFQGSVAGATVRFKNINAYDANGKNTLSVANLQMQNKIANISNKLLTINVVGSADGIKSYNAPAFTDIIPQTANLTATIRNMPVEYFTINQSTQEGEQKARAAQVAAGTQIQIDSLDLNSPSGLKATGTGLLTATNVSPTYNTGNVTINLANMADAIAKLQTQMGKNGMANTGPAMMAIMMLQGMGQTAPDKPGQTVYNINFTPDGQVTINGQNMTVLTNMLGMGKTGGTPAPKTGTTRSIPTPTAPTAPAMTPLKK